jgi:hypothetical protein
MKKHLLITFLILISVGFATAQPSKTGSFKHINRDHTPTLASYTCSMHPEINSDKAGKCPVCGMDLILKSVAQYTCPMHPEVLSTSPGKCPKCGMELGLKNPAPYSCPMHPEVTSDKPGKCPKCGMKLQKNKSAGHSMKGCCGM